MRLSAIAPLALAVAPVAVSAAGTLGFALGTKKADGSCKSSDDYKLDFDAISEAAGSKLVRGYSASDCNTAQEILPAAKDKGFQVILGIWPDVDTSFNADLGAIVDQADAYSDQIYAVTCGSETLYRGNFTGDELLEKINQVQQKLPNIKIGTADSWNKYADGTADALIKGGVKLLLINGFAYWQGQPLENATATYFDDMYQAIGHIQSVAGSTDSVEVWNGETGWPSDGGSNYGPATAGTDNAKSYYHSAVCGMLDWGVNVFYFEAFDEPWKPDTAGDNGESKDEKHWGAMNSDRTTKFDLKCS